MTTNEGLACPSPGGYRGGWQGEKLEKDGVIGGEQLAPAGWTEGWAGWGDLE